MPSFRPFVCPRFPCNDVALPRGVSLFACNSSYWRDSIRVSLASIQRLASVFAANSASTSFVSEQWMGNDGVSRDNRSSLAWSLLPFKSFALTKRRVLLLSGRHEFVGRVMKFLNYRRDKSLWWYSIPFNCTRARCMHTLCRLQIPPSVFIETYRLETSERIHDSLRSRVGIFGYYNLRNDAPRIIFVNGGNWIVLYIKGVSG